MIELNQPIFTAPSLEIIRISSGDIITASPLMMDYRDVADNEWDDSGNM